MSTLPKERINSIDVFRGLTILTMVFVNELAGVADIPQWLKHMPADADAMTFVDLVFPAFLFIVGMSIPFSTQARLLHGDRKMGVFVDGAMRAFYLIVIGFFMVNSIGGYDAEAMTINIHLWSLIMYLSILAIWCALPQQWPTSVKLTVRGIGILGLLLLAWLYKGSNNSWMTPQWWGILGLIGWAYIGALACYLAVLRRWHWLCLVAVGFVALFWLAQQLKSEAVLFSILENENRNHTHISMVVAGILLSLICFTPQLQSRKLKLIGYIAISGALAWLFSAIWPISKIWATPSWAFISIFCCALLFLLIYWLVEIKHNTAIVVFFAPAANNPLLIYILPYMLLSGLGALGWSIRPDIFSYGIMGVLWSFLFALAMMGLVTVLNRVGVKLKI